MAETKTQTLEREYIIPLRREWAKVPTYKKTYKSIKTIKEFIAKHMKIPDRDVEKVKLDVYLNNEIWYRGGKNPPSRVKVKAVKEGDIVKVTFVETPEYVKFLKAKHERRHKKEEKKVEAGKKEEPKTEEKKEEKTEEEKIEERKAEVEKEKAVEDANIKLAEKTARAEKHTTKAKTPSYHRMALKK